MKGYHWIQKERIKNDSVLTAINAEKKTKKRRKKQVKLVKE